MHVGLWLPVRRRVHARRLITTTWEDWQGWPEVEGEGPSDVHARPRGRRERWAVMMLHERYGRAACFEGGGLDPSKAPDPGHERSGRESAETTWRRGSHDLGRGVEASFTESLGTGVDTGWSHAAGWPQTIFNPDRIRADWLRSRLVDAAGWTAAAVDAALNACMDLSLLDAGEEPAHAPAAVGLR